MKIFVSAAEISSDLQAEKIIRKILPLLPKGDHELSGIGGPALRALPGFQAIEHAENMRAMGFVEVLTKLSFLRKTRGKILEHLKRNPPDLLITFDYPDFHFSLMKSVHKVPELSRTLKICGIPPKVWVWRKGRVEKIRCWYDGVWVIFPFERDFYERLRIPVIYEGNPLIADLFQEPIFKLPLVSEDAIRIAVMPGSRDAELKHHLAVIPATLLRLSSLSGKRVIAEVPIPTGVSLESVKSHLQDSKQVQYLFYQDGSRRVLARNHLGLIKSGTSTLEAAVLGCAPVIFYRVSPVSEWIFRNVVRYSGPVGLPNILLNVKVRSESVYKEFVGKEASSSAMAEWIFQLIGSESKLKELQRAGVSLKEKLVPTDDVSHKVAEQILKWILHPPVRIKPRTRSFWIGIGSFIWSTINSIRRSLYRVGIFPSKEIAIPSVLVGNLQAGGAGKTPVVIALAREALERGYRVGVVSRGYGAKYKGGFYLALPTDSAEWIGDEPKEILRSVPGVTLALSKDRSRAVRELEKRGINFVIFDDGFQNLKFRTRLRLLLITDAARDEVLYRDFDSVAKIADFVFQGKGSRTSRFSGARQLEWITEKAPEEWLWVLCGVADPKDVQDFYRSRGYRIARLIALPDHSRLDVEWVKKLMIEAKNSGARLAVTEKDWVKLESEPLSTIVVLRRQIANPEVFGSLFERLQ